MRERLLRGNLGGVLTLMLGASIAQVIPVLLSPILTRLYTPNDFGILDVFTSIASILASIASLKYEQAIVLPKSLEISFLLTRLSIYINLIFCVVLLLLVGFFSESFAFWLDKPQIRVYLFAVPFMVFFTAFFVSIRYYAIRNSQYKLISSANAFKALIGGVVQLGLGFMHLGTVGLISGQLSSATLINSRLYNKLKNDRKGHNLWDWKRDKKKYSILIQKYIDFPKFGVISTLANSLVLYGTSIFVFKIFSAEVLGYLALSNRVLGLPLNMISSAVGDVYLQNGAKERRECGNASNAFKKIFLPMMLLTLGGASIGYFILPWLFSFVFGHQWANAGHIASILLFLFGIRFINTPLSNTYVIFEKQKKSLYATVSQVLLLFIVFYVTIKFSLTFESYIKLYVVTQSSFYMIYLYSCWVIAKGGKQNVS